MVKKEITETVNFADLRKRAGLTLAELAERSGYSVATINGLELKGEGSPRLRAKLKEIFGEPLEEDQAKEILHRTRESPPPDPGRITKKDLERVKKQIQAAVEAVFKQLEDKL